MPKEVIGQAEVKVTANGEGFGRDLERDIRSSEPGVKRASEHVGGESYKSFQEGWVKGGKKDGTLADALHKDLEAGKSKFHADAQDIGEIFTGDLKKKLEEGFGGDIGGKMFDNIKKDVESGAQSVDDLGVRFQNLRQDFARAGGDFENSSKKIGGSLQNLRQDFARASSDAEKHGTKIGDTLHKIANGIGKAFGKGSRNNFLNFFGGLMSAAPHALATLADGLQGAWGKISGFFSDFNQQWTELSKNGQKSVGGFISALGSLAADGLPGLIAAVAAVGIAVQGFVLMLGVAGSAVSLLTGAILALAGAIGFALVGAAVAAAGALVPLGLAFGVAALGLSGLMKKGSNLAAFKKDWDSLQETVQKDMFGKDKQAQLETLRGLLKSVKPVIEAVATALGGIIKQFEKATQTKGFQKMMQDISKLLGPMIKTLGDIGGHLADFLGNAFIDAGPIIKEFLGWIDGVAKKLDGFSKGGKKSGLAKFFDDAWDSAKKVGRLIEDVAKIIGDLFGAGRKHGDNIIDGMASAAEDLHKWLSDPKNAGVIDQWFKDAEKLAGELGQIVIAAGNFIAALDTPTNRLALFWILDNSKKLIDFFTTAAGWADQLNMDIAAALLDLGKIGDKIKSGDITGGVTQAAKNPIVGTVAPVPALAVQGIAKYGPQITAALGDFGTTISQWFQQGIAQIPGLISQIVGFFTGLGAKIVTAAGDLAGQFGIWMAGVISSIPGIISQILGFFSGLGTQIITAAGDLASQFGAWLAGLPVQVITIVGQIIVGWIDLAGRIITAAGNIIGAFTQWLADLPGAAAQAVVNVVVAFINLGVRIINAAGSLASQFGVWIAGVPAQLRGLANQLASSMVGLAGRIIAAAGSLAGRFASWIAGLPGQARTIATQAVVGFANMAGRIISAAGSLIGRFTSWVAGLPAAARNIATQIANAFSGLADKAIRAAGSIVSKIRAWASGVGAAAEGVANDIVNAFKGLGSRIIEAIGTIIPKFEMPHITIPHITPIVDQPKAAGGIVNGAQWNLVGDAGPEAIVPLNRPLSMVDPAVRQLSAIAQGLARPGGASYGKSIDVGGITVITPTQDPRAVASEVISRMAAVAYI